MVRGSKTGGGCVSRCGSTACLKAKDGDGDGDGDGDDDDDNDNGGDGNDGGDDGDDSEDGDDDNHIVVPLPKNFIKPPSIMSQKHLGR